MVGKSPSKGVTISAIKFDLTEITALQENKDIWITESNIFLTVKGTDGEIWKEQITKLHPLATDMDSVTTDTGDLTSNENIEESTGNFKKNKIEPKENKMVITDFTKTVQKWINPYNKDKNEDNNGVALVNEYTDGSPETTDATTIIYFTVTDDTLESFQPKIDICFKEVPIKECSEPSKPTEVLDVTAIVLTKDENGNTAKLDNETLSHGKDLSGVVYRSVIKFDTESIKSGENFKTEIEESFIHLNYLGTEESPDGNLEEKKDRTVEVYKITKEWETTDDFDWDFVEENRESTPVATVLIEKSRVGGTKVTIDVSDLVRTWVEEDEPNYGVVLIDADEEEASLLPLFADEDTTEPDEYPPVLTVCEHPTEPPTPSVTTQVPSGSTTFVTHTTQGQSLQGKCQKLKDPDPEVMVVYIIDPDTPTVITDVPQGEDYKEKYKESVKCVSEAPIQQYHCFDARGQCKKQQKRDDFGRIMTLCECCKPTMEKNIYTFDCFGVKHDLEIKQIQSCMCQECTSQEIVEENKVSISERHAANYLLL